MADRRWKNRPGVYYFSGGNDEQRPATTTSLTEHALFDENTNVIENFDDYK